MQDTPRRRHGRSVSTRCAEIADIVATGYLRLQISRISDQNSLADHGQSEASCDSKAMSPKSSEDVA